MSIENCLEVCVCLRGAYDVVSLRDSRLPGVDYTYTSKLEMVHVAGHDRHAVNQRRGGDESIPIRAWIRYVEGSTPLGDSRIDR